MAEGTQRRLAAIVSADVVGYSRLMGADEIGTLATLRAHRNELWNPTIGRFGGRVVGTAGDSILVEFASAVAAVESSIAVQQGMVERNADLPEDQRMLLRIGINIGEVIVEDDDIFGDGVNVAARLQEIAVSGGIAFSGNIHEQIDGKLDGVFSDNGLHEFKNIARPVQVWRWSSETGRATVGAVAEEPLSILDKPSIAVLPFDNMSGDPDQEYFSDGLTEDIITVLSRLRWLFVIARNSTFQFKGSSLDIRQIGKDLDVRYVLEGSVRKAGSRVRISAQLIDTSSGRHIWAENYDRELDDVFALQDDVARQISACLAPEIERAEWRGLSEAQKPNLGSWDQYLRGLSRMHEYSRNGNIQAKEHFQKAIETEPNFASAHAALAYVIYHDINDGYVESREEAMRDAERHARKAITLDDQDSFGHCVLGRIYSIQAQFEDAITESRAAIKLNPSFALAYHSLGYALLFSGETEESIPLFEVAEKLSPHDHNVWAFLSIRAIAFSQLRDHDVAVKLAREAVRKPHAKFWAGVNLLSALGHTDKKAEAQETLKELLRQRPDFGVSFVKQSMAYYRDPVRFGHYLDGLRNAGLPEE
jgi:TolB-like protein/class 3 adenylate cyclase